MEDIKSAKHLISKGSYMCSIDLKDAYYLIAIHKLYRKFLKFRFQGKLYQFTCLQWKN